jgi:hypothetical protein
MKISRTCRLLLLAAGCLVVGRSALAQRTLTIQLQNAPNNMEPIGQPASIRVDDRSPVRLRLINISPLDICSLTRSPTPTVETNPFESLVSTISGLGAVAIGPSTANLLPDFAGSVHQLAIEVEARTPAEKASAPKPLVDDPVYKRLLDSVTPYDVSAKNTIASQAATQAQFDQASRDLLNYVARDYRGTNWTVFEPASAALLNNVRALFQNPLPSITAAASNQAALDELVGWAGYLHKTYEDPKYLPAALDGLQTIDRVLGKEKALMLIINDNNTALKSAQSSLRTAYMAILKVKDDFDRRRLQRIVQPPPPGMGPVLFQDFNLGTDRKATVTGTLSCVSATDGKTPTTDTINYSILYQDIPTLSASVGLLTSFLEKKVIGTTNVAATTNGVASSNQLFAITDRARAQIVPMAYVNYRLGSYRSYRSLPWGRTREGELAITFNLSGGFGINPNTGTNQPEFFLGPGIGFNRLMIHPGVHFGRTESLAGGFVLNTNVPSTFTGNPPIAWSYHPMISIGFSVRVAPY